MRLLVIHLRSQQQSGSPVFVATHPNPSPGAPVPVQVSDQDRASPTSAPELNYLILKAVINGYKRRLRRFPLVQTTLAEAVSRRILHP